MQLEKLVKILPILQSPELDKQMKTDKMPKMEHLTIQSLPQEKGPIRDNKEASITVVSALLILFFYCFIYLY